MVVRVGPDAGEGRAWALRVDDQGGGDVGAIEGFIRPESGFPDLEDERGRGLFLLAEMVDHLEVSVSPDGKGLSLEAIQDADA
jgi:anti-sigma regulatory factor (Ser/Thr protein kinase)